MSRPRILARVGEAKFRVHFLEHSHKIAPVTFPVKQAKPLSVVNISFA